MSEAKGTALFGGTFDPIHNAHIAVARAAADRFGLAKVLFIPAGNPPHKPGGAAASWEDRVRMTELACAADARFDVSRIEAPGLSADGKVARSYTIATIEQLRETIAGPLILLIGADAFREIRTWHRWRDLVAAVEFIVVTRPGSEWEIPPGARVRELPGMQFEVSSSDIRRQLAEAAAGGGSPTLDVAVPGSVRAYIEEHGLYRSQPE